LYQLLTRFCASSHDSYGGADVTGKAGVVADELDEETRVEAEAEVVSNTDSILTSTLVSMATKGPVIVVTATLVVVGLSNEGDVVRWR